MNHRIITHARAIRDLEERSEFIRRRNPRAALRFLDAAEATFRRLAAIPGLGARYELQHPVFADLRFLPISRFKHDLVFYRPLTDGIEVLRVLHGARDIQGILSEDMGVFEDADDDEIAEEGT